ncbi:MAG: alanine racemase [Bacillota bacterium]|nr:alanine racemase [Bacillota bacterium]
MTRQGDGHEADGRGADGRQPELQVARDEVAAARPLARAAVDALPAAQVWAEVDLDALRDNLALVRRLIPPPVQIMAVVKADAYGHGLIEVAQEAVAGGCEWLGAGNVREGLALREAGVHAPCLILAPLLPGEARAAVGAGLVPTVDTIDSAHEVAEAAMYWGRRTVDVHLLADAGLGRGGVRPGLLAGLAAEVSGLPSLRVGGIYTHFAAPSDVGRTRGELNQFLSARASVEREVGPIPLAHAAGSESAVMLPESRLDMVRLGNLIYGLWGGPRSRLPAVDGVSARPVWSMKTRIAAVHTVARGQNLSYGNYRASREMRIAVLPVGISDGLSLRSVESGAGARVVFEALLKEVARALVPRWRPRVDIGQRSAPLVGRVGMQFALVDITGIPDAALGDVVAVPAVRATAARGVERVYKG